MRRAILRLTALAVLFLPVIAVDAAEITAAQPKLPTLTLTIGKAKVTSEIADEEHERAAGLMFRESLGENDGMLFVMDEPGPAGFWMRNTTIPLSIAYINAVGVILEIHDLEPLNETPVQSQFMSIAYALEVPQGWFGRNGILPGDVVEGLPVFVED